MKKENEPRIVLGRRIRAGDIGGKYLQSLEGEMAWLTSWSPNKDDGILFRAGDKTYNPFEDKTYNPFDIVDKLRSRGCNCRTVLVLAKSQTVSCNHDDLRAYTADIIRLEKELEDLRTANGSLAAECLARTNCMNDVDELIGGSYSGAHRARLDALRNLKLSENRLSSELTALRSKVKFYEQLFDQGNRYIYKP